MCPVITPPFVLVSHLATENKSGSDCSGTDGATGRVLTLANTRPSSNERVCLDGLRLKNTQYTISHLGSSSTITFSVAVYDTKNIVVDYFI